MKLHKWWKSTLLNTHWWGSRQVPYNNHTQNTKEFFFPKILAEKTTSGRKEGLHPNKWTELLICISEIDVLCSMFELNFDCNPTYIIPDNINPVVLLIMGVHFVLFKLCNHFSNLTHPKHHKLATGLKLDFNRNFFDNWDKLALGKAGRHSPHIKSFFCLSFPWFQTNQSLHVELCLQRQMPKIGNHYTNPPFWPQKCRWYLRDTDLFTSFRIVYTLNPCFCNWRAEECHWVTPHHCTDLAHLSPVHSKHKMN